MAVISFWSNGKEETGKSSSIVAITTLLAINHNYKILVLDTKYNDCFYENCYWEEDKTQKLINGKQTKVNIESGISGLAKAILSNKTSPEIVTNYTRIVFKNRLELLTSKNVDKEEYETHKKIFKNIAKIASKYYDLVVIDIDNELDKNIKDELLQISDIVIASLPQKLRKINEYLEIKQNDYIFKEKKIVPILGRYDKYSKYTAKNIARYIKEKKGICFIPYNTLFFEACNEGKVADFFIKFRKANPKDKNSFLINSTKSAIEKIITELRDLQMRD